MAPANVTGIWQMVAKQPTKKGAGSVMAAGNTKITLNNARRPKRVYVMAGLGIVLILCAVGWLIWRGPLSSRQADNYAASSEAVRIPSDFAYYKNQDLGLLFYYPQIVGPLFTQQITGSQKLFVASKNTPNTFGPHTQGPLSLQAGNLADSTVKIDDSGSLMRLEEGKWVSASDALPASSMGTTGSLQLVQPAVARTIQNIPVYDFSRMVDTCYQTVWAFPVKGQLASITLPALCPDKNNAIPQYRLESYKKLSEQVLSTITIY